MIRPLLAALLVVSISLGGRVVGDTGANRLTYLDESDPFYVGLNAAYVTDFLNAVDTQNVTLECKDENSQCIGRPLGAEPLAYDYLYVVMPMRIA